MSAGIDSVTKRLESFREGIARLTALCETIGTEKDNQGHRRKVTKEKKTCDALEGEISAELREVKKTARELPQNGKAFTELSKEWGTLLRQYKILKTEVSRKEDMPIPGPKSRTVQEQSTTYNDYNATENHGGMENDITAALVPKYNTTGLETDLAIQQEKKEELEELEGNVNELATAFDEFSILVKEQEPELMKAKENVVTAQEHIQSGTEYVRDAGEYQKKSRKKMCCIAVLLLIIIIIIVVVVAVVG
ncbi:putative QA-SNARE [Diplonema papillatum]|nr:putative QA-SNARE [Diplonema papillatum]